MEKKATFGAGCFWGVEAAFRQLDGVAATRRLRALDPPPCVIAVSGHTDGLSRAAALEAGAAAFLSKDDVCQTLGDTILAIAGR